MEKLQSKNQTLYLQLAGVIVKDRLETPDFTAASYYQIRLKQLFNSDYEIKEIENELDLLLGLQQDEVLVYPDDHIQGI